MKTIFRNNPIVRTAPMLLCISMLLLHLLSLNPTRTTAQDEPLPPIYVGYIPSGISWSPDSQTFVYYDNGWHQYDPVTQQLTQTENWPLQPTLSPTERSLFDPPTSRTGATVTIHQSLNGHFILYGGEQVTNWWRLTIGNRQTSEVFTTSGFVLFPFRSGQTFGVLWSESNTEFVLTNFSANAFHRFTYGTNYADDLTNITLTDFSLPSQQDYYLTERDAAYDISSDGSFVLVHFTEAVPGLSSPYDQTRRLALWNPLHPSTTRILPLDATATIGASFAPNDDTTILYIDTSGLWQYDLTTNHATLINTEITATPDPIEGFERAIFSPDGYWVAIAKEIEYGTWGIFVLETNTDSFE